MGSSLPDTGTVPSRPHLIHFSNKPFCIKSLVNQLQWHFIYKIIIRFKTDFLILSQETIVGSTSFNLFHTHTSVSNKWAPTRTFLISQHKNVELFQQNWNLHAEPFPSPTAAQITLYSTSRGGAGKLPPPPLPSYPLSSSSANGMSRG